MKTCDANFHFQPLVDFGHALEILDTGGNVFLVVFFGQVQHVRGEQWLSIGLKIDSLIYML